MLFSGAFKSPIGVLLYGILACLHFARKINTPSLTKDCLILIQPCPFADIGVSEMSLFNFVTGFLVGVYTGLYASKNYNVPDVPDPRTIVDKVKTFLEENKKPPSD